RRRQRRNEGPRDRSTVQGRDRGGGAEPLRRLYSALPRRSALSRTDGAVDRTRRRRLREEADRRRRGRSQRPRRTVPSFATLLAEGSLGRARARDRPPPPHSHGRSPADGARMNKTFIPPQWLALGP